MGQRGDRVQELARFALRQAAAAGLVAVVMFELFAIVGMFK